MQLFVEILEAVADGILFGRHRRFLQHNEGENRCKEAREGRDPGVGYRYPFLAIKRSANQNPTSRLMRDVEDRGMVTP